MRFTLKNTRLEPVQAELAGWLENAVCLHSRQNRDLQQRNRVVRRDGVLFLECGAQSAPLDASAPARPDIVFDDFERDTYDSWEAQGRAFGAGPVEQGRVPAYQGALGQHGRRMVNSHATAPLSVTRYRALGSSP